MTGRKAVVGDRFAYASRNHYPYITTGEVLELKSGRDKWDRRYSHVKVRIDASGAYKSKSARRPYVTTYTCPERLLIISAHGPDGG